jgi:hypothetical protein
MNRLRRLLFALPPLAVAAGAAAQSSASHRIEQGTLNDGGHPPTVLSSPSHQLTLGSIGDGPAVGPASSASHQVGSGLPTVFAPPGEVTNLRLGSPDQLTWAPDPSVGSYNLYRGDIADLPTSYGVQIQSSLAAPATSDATQTPASGCLFYLITASNRLDEEGPKGFDSDGNPRP